MISIDTEVIWGILNQAWVIVSGLVSGVFMFQHSRITKLENKMDTVATKSELKDSLVEMKSLHNDLITEVRGLRREIIDVVKDVYRHTNISNS